MTMLKVYNSFRPKPSWSLLLWSIMAYPKAYTLPHTLHGEPGNLGPSVGGPGSLTGSSSSGPRGEGPCCPRHSRSAGERRPRLHWWSGEKGAALRTARPRLAGTQYPGQIVFVICANRICECVTLVWEGGAEAVDGGERAGLRRQAHLHHHHHHHHLLQHGPLPVGKSPGGLMTTSRRQNTSLRTESWAHRNS
jgi:hypothetical protein